MLQVFLWIKVLTNATIKAFLDSSFQKSDSLFILLQPAKAGTNDFAGIVVSATKDAVFDKLLIMRPQRYCHCPTHNTWIIVCAANVRIFLISRTKKHRIIFFPIFAANFST